MEEEEDEISIEELIEQKQEVKINTIDNVII